MYLMSIVTLWVCRAIQYAADSGRTEAIRVLIELVVEQSLDVTLDMGRWNDRWMCR